MVEPMSGKIVWAIKKDDFHSGNFNATFQLGNCVWSLSSKYGSPLCDENLSFALSFKQKEMSKCTLVSCWQSSGVVSLEGLDGRYNVMKAWSFVVPSVQFKVNNSILSFDEKYLFSDGAYHIGFRVKQQSSFVDFTSPCHALIMGPSDAGCLLIEDTMLYVSKTYFSAQSPFFKALFFGDYREKTQEVIPLQDVKLETFTEFLKHFYGEFHRLCRIAYAPVPEVLALADMFLCNTVTRSCELMLVLKGSATVADLELADKYNLDRLRYVAIRLLPIVHLRLYLIRILDRPELMCTRHAILDRIEEGVV